VTVIETHSGYHKIISTYMTHAHTSPHKFRVWF